MNREAKDDGKGAAFFWTLPPSNVVAGPWAGGEDDAF